MSTIHIESNKENISKLVLMPGDPLRAKHIAETYLTDVIQVNSIRNMLGYTGYYKGVKITVIGSGMGIPSMGIYSYELFKFYDVNKIIRIGTCGSYSKELKLFDVVLVDKTYSDSKYGIHLFDDNSEIIYASNNINKLIEETSKELNINIHRKVNHTSEVFTPYIENYDPSNLIKKYNCVTSEMEAYALFINAKHLNKDAACILTVSDTISDDRIITTEEREKRLSNAILLGLESLIK